MPAEQNRDQAHSTVWLQQNIFVFATRKESRMEQKILDYICQSPSLWWAEHSHGKRDPDQHFGDYRITPKRQWNCSLWSMNKTKPIKNRKIKAEFSVQTCTFVKLAKWNKVIRRRRHIWKRRLSMGPCRKLDWELFWVFTAGVKPRTLLSPYCLGITSKQSTNEEKEVERRPEGFLPPSFHKSSR